MKLNKEDWVLLDKLLSKCGFGGYYDLCECLKIAIRDIVKNIMKKNVDVFVESLSNITDLQYLVEILNVTSRKLNE